MREYNNSDIDINPPNQRCNFMLNNNLGFALDRVPKPLMSELGTKINRILEDTSVHQPYNTRLAGQIDEEYQLPLSEDFQKFIFSLFTYHVEESNYAEYITHLCATPPKFNFSLDNWVNFQKKHEYNPPHFHFGLYSWVVWYKIPYNIEDELKSGPGSKKGPNQKNYNGSFMFQYADGMRIMDFTFPVDYKWEGIICLFPASLTHSVMPFYTSDDYRITIAGNIKFQ